MANKMLIDATHPEETRVVVLRGNRVEEFDFESAQRKQLRGNIYLAKVTRVEPSLQAAFVDYGGNRHGFLAFSEIHPDYYQIPVADRQALIDEDGRAQRAADDEVDRRSRRGRHRHGQSAARRDGVKHGELAHPSDESQTGELPDVSADGGGPVFEPEHEDHSPVEAESADADSPPIGAAHEAETETPHASPPSQTEIEPDEPHFAAAETATHGDDEPVTDFIEPVHAHDEGEETAGPLSSEHDEHAEHDAHAAPAENGGHEDHGEDDEAAEEIVEFGRRRGCA